MILRHPLPDVALFLDAAATGDPPAIRQAIQVMRKNRWKGHGRTFARKISRSTAPLDPAQALNP